MRQTLTYNWIMFYEYEKIESQLKCPMCFEKYVSPRILPCGKTICQNCIDHLCNKSTCFLNRAKIPRESTFFNTFKIEKCFKKFLFLLDSFIETCPFCSKPHQAPPDGTGFILNEFIVKQFDIKPEKVYRCASYDKLDNLLEILNNDLKELTAKLEYPEEKIRFQLFYVGFYVRF